MALTSGLDRDSRPLSESEAEVYVASVCFKTGPPGAVGVEIERIVHDAFNPRRPVPVAEVRSVVAEAEIDLPGGGVITYEPGGQLELSSACGADLPAVIQATRRDLAGIDDAFGDTGLSFSSVALDPVRPPVRTLDHPRYAAMETHFDRSGPAGRTMMCSTSSLQVCLDAGLPGNGTGSAVQRWQRLHRLAPVLVALFGNSPFRSGAPSGWQSTREAVWLKTDPSRTAPVPDSEDPPAAWAHYALDASILCIPTSQGSWEAPRALTMREWLRGQGPRPVTGADLDYHLSTLFPFIRPRGFLEIRVIDAQAGSDWEAVAAITTALVDDEWAADSAAEACSPVTALPDPMTTAARDGLADPVLATAGQVCAEAALGAMERLGADAATRFRVESFVEQYAARGRSPADQRIDDWRRTGRFSDSAQRKEKGQ
ncbi:glutamate-cysteine ligase family protein [Arthrobacter roseus]|uniref:glutamate-cysteine ligase family protein n=1 Tax=Arthrobacter roseus TaxID=136274 RepID=UPI001963E48D|nr:glutamate-cysteine ligase family protein [Arthrobacter roseus]MBM7846781.1 glutamate--cysteine ligase [Arthrobacter roseus]